MRNVFVSIFEKGESMSIRELSISEINFVSGGNANSNYENGRNTSSSRGSNYNNQGRNNNSGFYGGLGQDVTNCNNGIIGGAIAGSLGGLAGVAVGIAGGAFAGGCFSHGNGNGGGSGANSNCSSSGIGGTCK